MKATAISYFLCPSCNHTIPIPRKRNRQRERGHIKDLYCPWCDKVVKTTEYREGEPISTFDGTMLK